MNNKYILGIISLIIIAGIIWWSTAKEPTLPPSFETKMMNTTGGSMVPMDAIAPKMHTVVYTNDGFSPAELTVKAGTMVTFMNQNDAPMWVASGVHPTHLLYPEFDAKASVPKGGSYSFTFNKIGSHPYHNHVLLGKYGKIIVE